MATSTLPNGAAVVSSVAELPLYQSLTPEQINELNDLLEEVSFDEGAVIFHQNDPGDAAYIIRSGLVRIWTHDEDAREVTLARLGPDDFFGELAVLDGGPRSASATALEPTTLGRLTKEQMQKFLLNHPQAALTMIQEIGRRLRQTNKIVIQRATRNVNVEMEEKMTIGQRVADKVASFGGSWTFIFLYSGFLLVWMAVNTFVLARMGDAANGGKQFDPYPYILLNLMLSMTAALQAPIIMMSQNRAGEKDRLAAENDFRVNLKSELMLEELTRRMDRLQYEQIEELLLSARALKQPEAQPTAAPPSDGQSPGAT